MTKKEVPESALDVPTQNATAITLKPFFSNDFIVEKNYARQVLIRDEQVTILDSQSFQLANGDVVQIVRDREHRPKKHALYLPPRVHLERYNHLRDVKDCCWLGDRKRSTPDEVTASLLGSFRIIEDQPDLEQPGLRAPQLGALHSILGYWTTDPQESATVVMPTGTGKTETMLAVYAHERIRRLLVLVPSDALRDQLAAKFETLGVLQKFGLVASKALRPIVGRLKHGLKSLDGASQFAEGCNVVITTPGALNVSTEDIRVHFLSLFTHLFVDEAHHLAARTWRSIRDRFPRGKVVQFTATPFREDGRPLKGRIIYAFPLREAQRLRLFSQLNYISVFGEGNTDAAVAERAVQRLREDRTAGFDHLLMARVRTIARAEEVLKSYLDLAPDFFPVMVHSACKSDERRNALAAIKDRASRVVVCVDMLGEGFDLPQLKIAAIHDAHKSLGVTLQFVGRFAREQPSLGPATVIVARPDSLYDTRLHELYREDSDWNIVIKNLSEQAVSDERDDDEFERAFANRSDGISMQMLEPKMSTVVYQTRSIEWNLAQAVETLGTDKLYGEISENRLENVAWFVTENASPIRWGTVPELVDTRYDLFVLYLDDTRGLLYIHGSNTDVYYDAFAKALCGDSTTLIKGTMVYRTMSGISRLVPTNVGVLDIRNHARRFSMHVGADVTDGFPLTEQVTKTQTNIFALGYESGNRVSIGASVKGRIWTYRIAKSLREWARWCDSIGEKLLNDDVNIDDVLKSFIRPKILESRPDYVVLALELPWRLFLNTTEEATVHLHDHAWPLLDLDLTLTSFERTGPVCFEAVTPHWKARYKAEFEKEGIAYSAIDEDAYVTRARKKIPLSEFFQREGLTFLLEKDAMIVHPNVLLHQEREQPLFDVSKFRILDWAGVNLRKESQGRSRATDSIQARVIHELEAGAAWDIVLDDDGSGEVADIVAMKVSEGMLDIRFIHCKYSKAGKPAARIDDLYEVCGQAQKSVRWARDLGVLFANLIRRQKRRAKFGTDRFSRGNLRQLYRLADESRRYRPSYTIAIAQPGLSKSRVTQGQLELLASTDLYLAETHRAEFEVYSSG